jgi:hypothetical protein
VELSVNHGGRTEVLPNKIHRGEALLVKKGSETCASKGLGAIQNSLRGGLGIAHAASDGSHGRALDSSEWALRKDAGGEAVCHTRKKNQVVEPVCTSGSDEIVENCVGFLLRYLGDVCAREISDVRYQILVFLGYFR